MSNLRHRNPPPRITSSLSNDSEGVHCDGRQLDAGMPAPKRDEVVWGKTPSGEVFRVPTTQDVLTTLFHPGYRKSHLDLLNLSLLALQLVIFFGLPRRSAQVFFFVYFAFWRAAYDAGLGWVLTKQSKKRWIVKEVQRTGWLDGNRRPVLRQWIRDQLAGKMGQDYDFDELPLEYNTWLLFRQAVDVILVNDFLSYCMFSFSCFRVPDGLPFLIHLLRWIGGLSLILFNLWVKAEAHNVVKDYGWYWGDVFFQRGALVFDGVFELAPHPMYSVGYAGYYGLSLIVGSYAVLFVSLAAHAAQFAFLVLFENPHIERMYGQPKAIAKRTPFPTRTRKPAEPATSNIVPGEFECVLECESSGIPPTPTATDGETATETELETETEIEEAGYTHVVGILKRPKILKHRSNPSESSSSTVDTGTKSSKRKAKLSHHDLLNKYFRRDAVILQNVDLLRANDAMLVLLITYTLSMLFLPRLSDAAQLQMYFLHALLWVLVHHIGLGLLLDAQSKTKYMVRHFMKNYHYAPKDDGKGAVVEAFTNWKALYNLSMCMTYVSYISVVWKTYSIPHDWTVGNESLRHTVGVLTMALHIWATKESYQVLGVFGWFFGDFFMEEFPANLEYSGIYRYLNNPEAISDFSWSGLALISGSKLVWTLAVVRLLANMWFLRQVEHPHMKKLYGDSLRKEAGFVKVMRNVASKNAKLFESQAERHTPNLQRVVKEVKGTFDKVLDETAEVMEEFIAKSRPVLSEVVEDTKMLLQQSKERLVIPRVSSNLSWIDRTTYQVSIVSSTTFLKTFHLGEPIKVVWEVPPNHSRKDWIGLYRVGANKSALVTKTSALGMWLPIHDEEWDGDFFTGATCPQAQGESRGTVIFKGNTLPWQIGRYEIRYHHDGKYDVMGMDGPVDIFVDKPSELTFDAVRKSLMRIVPLCLDSDPSLIPLSCKPESHITEPDNPGTPTTPTTSRVAKRFGSCADMEGDAESEELDPDDFAFWSHDSQNQANRICEAIRQAFGVEYAAEVVVAAANLSTLANRILVSKEVLL